MRYPILYVTLISLMLSGFAYAIEIEGYVDGEWILDESPYIVTDDITVRNGESLTIEPGVEIRFDGSHAFWVFGTISAVGTDDAPILFTTNREGRTWRSIRLNGADNCEFSYCIFEFSERVDNWPEVDGRGGAIYGYRCDDFTLTHSVFRENSTNGIGGGICFFESNGVISDNHFYDNWSFSEVVWLERSEMPFLRNLVENNLGDYTAGVYVALGSPLVSGNTIRFNESGERVDWGSALYFVTSNSAVTNNLIYGNINGALYFGVNCNIRVFEHNVIYGNVENSAIVVWSNSHVEINNSIIWDNTDPIWIVDGSSSIDAQYSLITNYDHQDMDIGDGMLDENPRFVDPDDGDFSLTENSPCIDAGDPDSPNDPDESRTDIGLYFGDFIPGDPDDPGDPPPHFEFVETAENHSIVVEMATFEDEELVEFDEIAAFTPDGVCAGATIVDGEFPTGFVAFASDHQNEIILFEDGDPLQFRIWRWEEEAEYPAEADFTEGDGRFRVDELSILTLASFLPEEEPPPTHFEFVETNGNHSLLIDEATFEDDVLVEFDEIGVFTPDGVCAGAARVEEGEVRFGISVFQADDDIAGFEVDEPFSFRFWKWEIETEFTAEADYSEGPEVFEVDGFSILTLSAYLPQHPFEFVETATSHSFLIFEIMVDGEPVPVGDAFGIFTPEDICVGAGIWEGRNFGIAAWADDDETEELEGFRVAEEFLFKRWDSNLDEVSDIAVTVIEGDLTFQDDGVSSVILGDRAILEKTISFNQGWNLISCNIEPITNDVVELFAPLTDGEPPILTMLKDQIGRFYRPSARFSNIEGWVYSAGYQAKLTQSAELTIEGYYIEPNRPIATFEGWQVVAYYPSWELSPEDAFASIADNMRIIKNSAGQFYMPEREFNNIDICSPGQGYRLKMYNNDNLVYPADEPGVAALPQIEELHHFGSPKITTGNMSLLLETDNLASGVEVAAFRSDGLLVGSGVVNINGECGMALWGDDEFSEQIDGLRSNEVPYFKIWDGEQECPADLALIEGQIGFTTDGFAIGKIVASGVSTPTEYTLSEPYPNPFNDRAQITFSIPEAKDVRLELLDISGRLVTTLVNKQMPTGYHTVSIHAKGLSSGIYWIRLTTGSRQMAKRVVLMR